MDDSKAPAASAGSEAQISARKALKAAEEARDPGDLEDAYLIACEVLPRDEYLALARRLLRVPWHHLHDWIAEALDLERDPEAVEVLYWLCGTSFDDTYGYTIPKRAVHALSRIDTEEAERKLDLLRLSDDPVIFEACSQVTPGFTQLEVSSDQHSVTVYATASLDCTERITSGERASLLKPGTRLWTSFLAAATNTWWGARSALFAVRLRRSAFDALTRGMKSDSDLPCAWDPSDESEEPFGEWIPKKNSAGVPLPMRCLRINLATTQAQWITGQIISVTSLSERQLDAMRADETLRPVEVPYGKVPAPMPGLMRLPPRQIPETPW